MLKYRKLDNRVDCGLILKSRVQTWTTSSIVGVIVSSTSDNKTLSQIFFHPKQPSALTLLILLETRLKLKRKYMLTYLGHQAIGKPRIGSPGDFLGGGEPPWPLGLEEQYGLSEGFFVVGVPSMYSPQQYWEQEEKKTDRSFSQCHLQLNVI